jgi:taurine dioxygenase
MSAVLKSAANLNFTVELLTPTIGAEIHGIDLAREVDDATIANLRATLVERKVIFFRDQKISSEQHIAFARRFGPLEIHPATAKHQPNPEILRLTHDENSRGRENNWHSDVTWRAEPSMGSILRAIVVPDVGGDTLFSDMEAAYESLSPGMKRWAEQLVAIHDFRRVFAALGSKIADQYPPQEHPVVRTHPESGRKSLFVNIGFTSHIKDLARDESEWLLNHFYARAKIPEFQCRFRWKANSIAFWDNRACQHYAASDYFPARRTMERVTVAGDRPFFDPERSAV